MKYDIRVCSCGRIHVIPYEKIDTAITEQKEFLLVCGSCGVVTAVGADYYQEGAYGFEEPSYDIYSYDISKPFSITSDMTTPNGRNIAEIFFNRGIGVPMMTGEYATYYNPCLGFFDTLYCSSRDLNRDDIAADEIHDILNKFNHDRTTVDMNRLILENRENPEILEAISTRHIEGLDWSNAELGKTTFFTSDSETDKPL